MNTAYYLGYNLVKSAQGAPGVPQMPGSSAAARPTNPGGFKLSPNAAQATPSYNSIGTDTLQSDGSTWVKSLPAMNNQNPRFNNMTGLGDISTIANQLGSQAGNQAHTFHSGLKGGIHDLSPADQQAAHSHWQNRDMSGVTWDSTGAMFQPGTTAPHTRGEALPPVPAGTTMQYQQQLLSPDIRNAVDRIAQAFPQ